MEKDIILKKISIRSKLYINIVPIIIIGVIASFAALYYIANEKYSDYLYDQYEYDIEYLKDISVEIIQNGTIPSEKYIRLPDSCAGIRVYDLNDNLIYTKVSKNNMMNDISCCDFISYEIEGYGRLEIYSHCAIEHTEDSIGFRKGLIWAVIIAGFITVLITILVINRMANRMSKELNGVSEYAGKMETGIMETSIDTNIVEIDNINSSLHNLGVRLAEKERLRKEKIDLIKHQLSTPLTIIKTTLEGMMDDVVELDKEYIERCITENDRIKEKLESLYVDIESNTETIKKEKTNLKDLINEIVDSFSVSFGQKGVKLVTDLEDLILETDKNLLIASIYNILSNSYL